ncbi:hypothetical protein LINPERPRIM_LOCUS39780 [Linum perenne]
MRSRRHTVTWPGSTIQTLDPKRIQLVGLWRSVRLMRPCLIQNLVGFMTMN